MKKGQAELLGLVFIVLILVVVLLFYVRYSGQIDSSAITIRSNIRVNNMLNALMLVHVDGKYQFKDVLIKACDISSDPNDCTNNITFAKTLLDKMKEGRENYELKLEGDRFVEQTHGKCEEGIAATPARFRKPSGLYTVKLKLC